ncbi:MAG TPA: hypothetical protein P5061_03225 [Mycobacterium sp.]|nr:hypothetical protein [Mycobacterium sp.]
MGILPKPRATLGDAEVADGLGRAVAVINPLLDLLAETDATGLRGRTHRLLRPPRRLRDRIRRYRLRRRRAKAGRAPSSADRARNAGARVLDAADLPGTASWQRMDRDERVHWWVNRVGALDNLVVASPGAFGALARFVPVADLAGFVNQAVILCAVAREYGVTDQSQQVRLLAEVLCRRTLPDGTLPDGAQPAEPPRPEPLPQAPPTGWKPLSAITSSMPVQVTRTMWQLAGILRAIFEEAGKRPQPTRWYRWTAMLPGIGWIASYVGEHGALARAARAGQGWLTAHQAGAAPGAGEPD